MTPPALAVFPGGGLDLRLTLSPLRRGTADPTFRVEPDGTFWRTTRAAAGPATLRLRRVADGRVEAAAWGPGAESALDSVPALLGGLDDASGFEPAHPLLRELLRRTTGWRLTRTGQVFESLVPTVLEQQVLGIEARRSWRDLVRRFGTPAPGPAPAGLRVMPEPQVWRRLPSWEWHRAGVDDRRARIIVRAAGVAGRLDQLVELSAEEAGRRLRTIAGIGAWTAAEVRQRAFGDADAVSVGDYHLPSVVGWALAGRRVDDAGMLELLEPYRPHRHRVARLLELAGPRPPRYGPRLPVRDFRHL